MQRINFNRNFLGFKTNEDIFLDTCIVLALLNKYDSWYPTVQNLFSTHVIQSANEPTFYVHSGIITEVTKIADKPLDKYMKAFNFGLSQDDIDEAIDMTLSGITELLENEIINLLDINSTIMKRQVKYSRYFDATDSLTVSLLEEYSIGLLTVDSALIRNIAQKSTDFPHIGNLYYTTSNHRAY